MYAIRSYYACREFEAGDERCNQARALHGLLPLGMEVPGIAAAHQGSLVEVADSQPVVPLPTQMVPSETESGWQGQA